MLAVRHRFRSLTALFLLLSSAMLVSAQQRKLVLGPANEPIEGVQTASLDQPRIHLQLKRTARGNPLGNDDAILEAFLDTGASGLLLSSEALDRLAIKREKSPTGKDVIFEDVGVAGADSFGVSEPLFLSLASYPSAANDPAAFAQPLGPFRLQIRPAGGLLQLLAPGGLNVAGMPAMNGKVVVMDPTPLAKFDKIRTAVVAPNDRNIPRTSRHVPLTYVSFAPFTRTTPKGSRGPDLQPNPFIGPDPFNPADRAKPVTLTHNNKSATGTFLLDTGAASSMISSKLAKQLGLDLANPNALVPPNTKTFDLAIGGIGGQKQSKGAFFSKLQLPTREGPPIIYAPAPFLVTDITVKDETGKEFTLDGVLGMNYLVATANVTGGLIPDIGNIHDGPWKAIVIDHAKKVMGLEPR